MVARPPSRITVARRATVASRPPHSAASFTSPWSLTHSASTPAGTTSCGMPGAVLTQASPASSDSTNDHGGVQVSSENVRPRPVRRAGSTNATSNGRMSTSSASATPTAPGSPSASRFAVATATRTGSRSTPAAVSPARAKATRSPPMPQPRSTTVEAPNAVSRAARWEATESRVACSSPSGVKYIDAARSPNFGTARARRSAWVSATASRSGGVPGAVRASASRARSGSGSSSATALASTPLAVLGQQPRHRLDVHGPPSHRPTLALH